jgi:hypothetical protein
MGYIKLKYLVSRHPDKNAREMFYQRNLFVDYQLNVGYGKFEAGNIETSIMRTMSLPVERVILAYLAYFKQ